MGAAHLKGPMVPFPRMRMPVSCVGKTAFTDAALALRCAKKKPGNSHCRCRTCGLWHTGGQRWTSNARPNGLVRAEPVP